MINDIGFTIIYIYVYIYIYISRVVRYSQFPGRIGTLMAPEMPKIPMKCIPEKRMVLRAMAAIAVPSFPPARRCLRSEGYTRRVL